MNHVDVNVIRTAWERFMQFSPGSVTDVSVFFAPGRVNLIGEHIDYNGGLVFPAALTLGTWLFVRPRADGRFRFASTAFSQVIETPVTGIRFVPEDDYANYPKAVLWVLSGAGAALAGADLLFAGNLPNSAGLSSSASVELATAVAVQALSHTQFSMVDLVQFAQRAENEFVGVNCGIMDQFAVGMGKADHAILLDCERLDYRMIPFVAAGHQLVITNTNKRRGLADSKYNERRTQCEHAVRDLQKARPGLRYLTQITVAEWEDVLQVIADPVIRKRARHVVFEHERTKRAADHLRDGELGAFGKLLNESHTSLRDDYEVTGHELDALAEAAWSVPGCLGSRMTGAGFGGCTVSLVKEESMDEFMQVVGRRYTNATGLAPSFYISSIGDGAKQVTKEVLDTCLF